MAKIISLTIHKHKLLGGKKFELSNRNEESTNYYSVIIGPNGTGKSNLLSFIIDFFNEMALLKSNKDYKLKNKFSIEFEIEGDIFSVDNSGKNLIIKKNEVLSNIDDLVLPNKWLASSVTINDKYPILNYLRKKQIKEYEYLGIRSASNNAFISRLTINTVLHFIDSLQKGKRESLLNVYESLSLKPQVDLVFVGGPMLKLEKVNGKYTIPKNKQNLIQSHISFLKKNKSKTSYRADNYKRHIDTEMSINNCFKYILNNQEKFQKSSKSSIQLKYQINLYDSTGIVELLNDWEALSILLDLELIKIQKFIVLKDNAFKYEEASSGESHLLSSLHGITSKLTDNSLLIIDEPEISLHPNWQIEYLEILKSILAAYKGVNIIISTHSHFIVSSLKNIESRITSINRNKNFDIVIEELDYETYGWEPERILYKIFGLVTQRNNYFELDLRKLIELISSKDSNIVDVKNLHDKLESYILSDIDDPLQIIITRAKKYLTERNAN